MLADLIPGQNVAGAGREFDVSWQDRIAVDKGQEFVVGAKIFPEVRRLVHVPAGVALEKMALGCQKSDGAGILPVAVLMAICCSARLCRDIDWYGLTAVPLRWNSGGIRGWFGIPCAGSPFLIEISEPGVATHAVHVFGRHMASNHVALAGQHEGRERIVVRSKPCKIGGDVVTCVWHKRNAVPAILQLLWRRAVVGAVHDGIIVRAAVGEQLIRYGVVIVNQKKRI